MNSTEESSEERKQSIVIAGDSIIKYVKGWELSDAKKRVTVKSFSGATVEDMDDFVKPLLRKQPDTIVLHVGTNDLRNSEPQKVADAITDPHKIENQAPDINIAISGLITRTDSNELTSRVRETNRILRAFCNQNGWCFAPNRNTNASHLNPKGLHLNRTGSALLQDNFSSLLSNS